MGLVITAMGWAWAALRLAVVGLSVFTGHQWAGGHLGWGTGHWWTWGHLWLRWGAVFVLHGTQWLLLVLSWLVLSNWLLSLWLPWECWNALSSLCLELFYWFAMQALAWLKELRGLWSFRHVRLKSISSADKVGGLSEGLGCGQGMQLWVIRWCWL